MEGDGVPVDVQSGQWSDLPQYLHDGDGGALAEDEGPADQRERPPEGEGDSENTKRLVRHLVNADGPSPRRPVDRPERVRS